MLALDAVTRFRNEVLERLAAGVITSQAVVVTQARDDVRDLTYRNSTLYTSTAKRAMTPGNS